MGILHIPLYEDKNCSIMIILISNNTIRIYIHKKSSTNFVVPCFKMLLNSYALDRYKNFHNNKEQNIFFDYIFDQKCCLHP